MFTKDLLKNILLDQKRIYKLPSNYVHRTLEDKLLNASHSEISIITGVRRVGKSTLLLALQNKLGGDYYINFDDERLIDFSVQDFQTLFELFLELYGEQEYFYFDEIQNVKGWERFIRRLYDMGKHIFITGSNANLLSADLGTHLTGRYIPYELYPFSFREFLSYKGLDFDLNKLDTWQKVELIKQMSSYIEVGGIPQYVFYRDSDYLRALYQSILSRDIIRKYKIRHVDALEKLGRYLCSNYSRLISARKLTQIIGVKNHSTVMNYLSYLQNAYLVFLVPVYAYSLKSQYIAPKKVYIIDLSLASAVGFSFSQEIGHKLENLVFLDLLRRQNLEVYYYKEDSYECDFILQKGTQVVQALQVVYELTDKNKKREVRGLIKAMNKFKLNNGLIISFDQKEVLNIDGKTIYVKPVYEWLLENTSK